MSDSPYSSPSAPGPGSGRPSGQAKAEIKGPAIGLLVGGILSVLVSLYLILNGVMVMFVGEQIMQQQDPNAARQLEQMKQQTGMDPSTFFQAYGIILLVWAVVLIILSIVIIVGAVKMMQLKSRGLAYAAAIMSIIPCTTGCCLVGLPFGIWAVVVMSKPEVKSAFR